MLRVTKCILIVSLLVVCAHLLIVPADVSAQPSCGGLTYVFRTQYSSGGSFSIPVGPDDLCFRFEPVDPGTGTYYVDELGGSLIPRTGVVTILVNPGLNVALLTGTDSIRLFVGFTPLPTSTPSETPTVTPTPGPSSTCYDLSSEPFVAGFQVITFPAEMDVFNTSGREPRGDFYLSSVELTGYTTVAPTMFLYDGGGSLALTVDLGTAFIVPYTISMHTGKLGVNVDGPYPFSIRFCSTSLFGGTPTPTITLTPSNTPTITPTPSNTPTSTIAPTVAPGPIPPGYTNCSTYVSSAVGSAWGVTVNGDLFDSYVRGLWDYPEGSRIVVSGRNSAGATISGSLNSPAFLLISQHTLFVSFTGLDVAVSANQFSIQVCRRVLVVTPTSAVFGTYTPTPSPTQTPIVSTPTVVSTSTPIPSCATPGTEDSAECELIKLQETAVALLQPPVVSYPSVPPSPVPNYQTAVAIICLKDPCASVQIVSEGVHQVIEHLQAGSTAPDCASVSIPFGGGPWALPSEGVGTGFCAFITWTTDLRALLRLLSVFFFAFLAIRFLMKTWEKAGDV